MESVAITQVKLEAYKDVYVNSRFQDTYMLPAHYMGVTQHFLS